MALTLERFGRRIVTVISTLHLVPMKSKRKVATILILELDLILNEIEKQYQYPLEKNWIQKLACHYGICIVLKINI